MHRHAQRPGQRLGGPLARPGAQLGPAQGRLFGRWWLRLRHVDQASPPVPDRRRRPGSRRLSGLLGRQGQGLLRRAFRRPAREQVQPLVVQDAGGHPVGRHVVDAHEDVARLTRDAHDLRPPGHLPADGEGGGGQPAGRGAHLGAVVEVHDVEPSRGGGPQDLLEAPLAHHAIARAQGLVTVDEDVECRPDLFLGRALGQFPGPDEVCFGRFVRQVLDRAPHRQLAERGRSVVDLDYRVLTVRRGFGGGSSVQPEYRLAPFTSRPASAGGESRFPVGENARGMRRANVARPIRLPVPVHVAPPASMAAERRGPQAPSVSVASP